MRVSLRARHGGSPASVGHKIAFGNTLETLHRKILGIDARGSPADGPLDHHTGKGCVAEHRGNYYDALKIKKLKVIPLVTPAVRSVRILIPVFPVKACMFVIHFQRVIGTQVVR